MSIKVGEKKILRSPLEPKDRNWLWLKTVAGFPVLHEYLSGKWVPFSDATAEYVESNILSRVFGSTKYDKAGHCIEFYAADGSDTPIGVIDMSEFEIPLNTDDYYTKDEVEDFVAEYVSEHGGTVVDLSDYYTSSEVDVIVSGKVDIVSGKGLSSNDYTDAEQTKLAGLENYDDSALQEAIDGKVDKESGKSLMTDAEHTKLAGIDPSTYATKTEVNAKQDTINDLDAIRSGAALGATALQSFTEEDPTVPSWAKASTKPTYTAQEVGALPSTTTIPTDLGDLTNNAGYTKNTGTITGITMNGVSKGTSGVVDLGTVITSHQDISSKANASDVYTKTQTDTLLAGKQNTLTTSDTLATINGTPLYYGGSVSVQGEKGDKGDTGNVQVDGNGNVLIYNGLDKTTTGAALDASQGQFIGKMLNAKDSTFYNVWVGTAAELEALDGDYDDNTIYLVGTIAAVAQRFNVNFNGGDHTSVPSNTPQTAKEGSAFSVVISPASGYTIDTATGTMVGGTLTKTNNQDGTVTFSTSAVTGAITITAAATKHITGIAVSSGTRSGNTIPLSAVVSPAGADNVTLAWSVNDTTNFGISGSGTDATLIVKSGASDSTVTITCADTNVSSGTASGTLQLTLSYIDVPIPITEISDITATRTAANEMELTATTDGNTGVTFAIDGSVPTIRQVRRWDAGDTVDGEVKESAGYDIIEQPAVTVSGNKMYYKGDCIPTVKAVANNDSSVTYSKQITIAHDGSDVMWFEDEEVLNVLKGVSGLGNGTGVTYSSAAACTKLTALAGNTTIISFLGFMYFSGITKMGKSANTNFRNCSKLAYIGLPANAKTYEATYATDQAFNGCKLKEVHVTSLTDFLKINYNAFSGNYQSAFQNAGKDSSGMGLFYNGEEIKDLVVPDDVTTLKVATLNGFNRLTSVNTNKATNFPAMLEGCTGLTSVVIGDMATTVSGSAFKSINVVSIVVGSGITSLPTKFIQSCASFRNLTLKHTDAVVTGQSDTFYGINTYLSQIKIYVPSALVQSYVDAGTPWSSFNDSNILAIS